MKHGIRFVSFTAGVVLAGCGSTDPEAACKQSLGNDYLPLAADLQWQYDVSDPAGDLMLGEKGNKILELDGSTAKIEISGVLRPGVRWLRTNGTRYEWLRNVYLDPTTHKPTSDQYYDPPALRFDADPPALRFDAGQTTVFDADPPVLRFDAGLTSVDESWHEPIYQKTTIDIASCPGWAESLGAQNLMLCPAGSITTEQVKETWTVVAVDEALSEVQARLEPDRHIAGVPAGDFQVLCEQRRCAVGGCVAGVYCFARGVGKVYELSSEREELASRCFPEHSLR